MTVKMKIEEIINHIYPMPAASVSRLAQRTEQVHYPRGHHLIEQGRVEPDLFLMVQGAACAYTWAQGKKITFWIGCKGSILTSLKSYVSGEPGYETIELMEDSILYRLRRSDLYRLYDEDIHIANWGRKFAEQEFMHTEEHLIPMLFTTAMQRYTLLLRGNPQLLQRIPLESLATWLGITPVSLSRIRKSLKGQE